jgi:carboxymethylenebutenolidase
MQVPLAQRRSETANGRQTTEKIMGGITIKIAARGGGEFDCYIVTPDDGGRVPAVVLASAVHGVDADIRAIADEFADNGFIAAAPDLFWRSIPGPLARDDERTKQRSQPRLQKIKEGEADLADTLVQVNKLAQFNGRAACMGFCYGGPYAILGPKRLGYAAGISCHGSQMLDYVGELEGVAAPVCIVWGDADHLAPAPVLDAYRTASSRMKNLGLHVFPGVQHGFMMRGSPAFDQATRDFSMRRAFAVFDCLREKGAEPRLRHAS